MEVYLKCPACESEMLIEVENRDDTDPLICLDCGTGIDIKKKQDGGWYLEEE